MYILFPPLFPFFPYLFYNLSAPSTKHCSLMTEKTHFMAHQIQQPPSVSATPHNEIPSQKDGSESDHHQAETKSETQDLPAPQTGVCGDQEKMALPELVSDSAEESGREKLKKHRVEVAGSVWIPERWGHEELLKDWIDCSAFDAPLVPNRIMTARAALVREGTGANAEGFRIENRICAKLESAKSQR